MFLRFQILLVFAVSLVLSSPARADEAEPVGDIVCSKSSDAALARFGFSVDGGSPEYHPLPSQIDDGLSSAAASGTDCRLPNGWPIRVRVGEGQAFAYGAGGADPPAYFSLWIAGHQIASHLQWKPGYGSTEDWIVALVIRPDRLVWCRMTNDDVDSSSSPAPPTCEAEPLDLENHPIDYVEYPPPGHQKPAVGTIIPTDAADGPKGFCTSYLKADSDLSEALSSFSYDLRSHYALDVDAQDSYGQETDNIQVAPGTTRKMLSWSGSSHFFDGDVVLLTPNDADVKELLSKLPFDDNMAKMSATAGWTLIAGGQPALYPNVDARYVHLIPIRYQKHLYFIAYPTNHDVTPPALLIGVSASGHARTVCSFKRVDPHF